MCTILETALQIVPESTLIVAACLLPQSACCSYVVRFQLQTVALAGPVAGFEARRRILCGGHQ